MSNERARAPAIQRRGLMLVLSSPSGAGKTTLSRKLLEQRFADLSSCRSRCTTRPRRPGEKDGVDYNSSTRRRFARHDRRAASSSSTRRCSTTTTARREAPVDAALGRGRDVLFDIDWQGTQQLKEKAREDLVSVFILPPSTARARAAPEHARPGLRRGRRPAHGQGRRRDEPLGRIRLRRHQPRYRRRA